jgi:predicted DCC family thiol-disulfide oxidoreductase YuxK
MKEKLYKIFNAKIDALGLSVFRMCYAVVLGCELLQLFKFRNILYDDIPFQYGGEMFGGIVLMFNFSAVVLLFLGCFTRFTTIVNYLFGIIIFGSMSRFEYHVHYAYVGINFLLMFMPVSRVFSLDSLFQKLKYAKIGRAFKIDRAVLAINYFIPIFVAIALVYFDSVFRKMASPMWRSGLGVWLPSSLPMAVWNDTSLMLNQEYLIKFLGYLVIVFESVFIFLFWFKRFRIPFLLLGLFFHTGILITYPIPWFALTVIVTYFLMVPVGFWMRISSMVKCKEPVYTFYYDAECPLCQKVVIIIRHFDVFNRVRCVTVQGFAAQEPVLKDIPEMNLLITVHGVARNNKMFVGYDAYMALLKSLVYTYPLALIASLPGIATLGKKIYNYIAGNRLTERCTNENCLMPEFATPVGERDDFLVKGWNRLNLSKQFWKYLVILIVSVQLIIIALCPFFRPYTENNLLGSILSKSYELVGYPAKKILGVTSHPVFTEGHFKNYNHIFKIVCDNNNKLVPLRDENGMVTKSYANGAFWVNYTFRVNARRLYQNQYEEGVIKYLRYYQHRRKFESSSYTFYVKTLDYTSIWKKDYLRKQMNKPWVPAGTCILAPTGVTFKWNEEMQAIFVAELEKK